METWQFLITICAGCITVITFLDKIGVLKRFQKIETDSEQLALVLKHVDSLQVTTDRLATSVESITSQNQIQNQALLALLRNDLYRCFKNNRDLGVWTDDEFQVQTKIHEAYLRLGGNGEEAVWWEKKKNWKIVSEETFYDLTHPKNNSK